MPIYRFNREPQFSVNHLSKYLVTTDANQREGVIREAKFPRTIPVSSYTQARNPIVRFLTDDAYGYDDLNEAILRLQLRAQREPDKADECNRCINGIQKFIETHQNLRWNNFDINAAQNQTFTREGVLIKVQIHAEITRANRNGDLESGGVVLYLANSTASRRNIDARSQHAANLLRWSIEENSNIEPSHRICFSYDVFGNEVVRATQAFDLFRRRVDASCREVAQTWHGVAPPPNYDGPDWH